MALGPALHRAKHLPGVHPPSGVILVVGSSMHPLSKVGESVRHTAGLPVVAQLGREEA